MAIPPTSDAGNPLKGVALVLAATFLFACGDTLGKHLSMLYAAALILSARYVINLVLVLVTMWPRHRSAVWRTQRTGLVILRGLLLAFATVTMLLALRVMPVAETVAIIYITPVLLMLASGPILGERVSALGWVCATLGFAGVLLIARPGSGLDSRGVVLCLLNAFLGTGYHLLTRILTRTETTMALLFHTALVGSVISVGLALALGVPAWPTAADALMILLYASCATVGHLLFTSAYREAPASTLAPVNYMHIAFATMLGWLVFRHLPDALGFTGMALIAVAGLLAAWRASRTPTTLPVETLPEG
ncbi:DMT family transporter [Tabrizicola sp.]|uniref:DMT family transporter n=1 Tax=Tabrizicola sp. TaxID=2005166 RepID=UPI001A5796B3|nr:DMT family transporter [Tabrizicola sp.]MBL9063684.1 DMT family transporter [Tabrizicola sp.]